MVLVFVMACRPNKPTIVFYPVDSLITAQVLGLSRAHAKLRKEAVLGSETDTAVFTPDSAAWADELGIFRQLDVINKPVNLGTYLIRDNQADPGSNLTIRSFTSTTNQPVRYLRIYYHEAIDKPRKIEALFREDNALYSTSRLMSMEFQQVDNKIMLTSYSIRGSQDMVLEDSIAFSVRGKLQFN